MAKKIFVYEFSQKEIREGKTVKDDFKRYVIPLSMADGFDSRVKRKEYISENDFKESIVIKSNYGLFSFDKEALEKRVEEYEIEEKTRIEKELSLNLIKIAIIRDNIIDVTLLKDLILKQFIPEQPIEFIIKRRPDNKNIVFYIKIDGELCEIYYYDDKGFVGSYLCHISSKNDELDEFKKAADISEESEKILRQEINKAKEKNKTRVS